ncbi:MAG: hypothetical protein NVS3B5_14720 [Sphingomicrobium sp.]
MNITATGAAIAKAPDDVSHGHAPGMLGNAESAMEFFKLPANRVVELGRQVEI